MLPEDLAYLPWPFLMASTSLLTLLALFRYRPDVFERFGFGREEVALLSLGAIAGWAVNLPVIPLGSSYLALNLGGALLCIFLAGLWMVRGLLPLLRVTVGVAIVAAITHAIVVFEPDVGIIAVFPWFFLPPLAALAYALIVTIGDANRTVPVAFTAGSIGALVGADLLNIPDIAAHFSQDLGEAAVVSVGGAGVFDMVFLAGILPMAGAVAVLTLITPRLKRRAITYPAVPLEARDGREVWRVFRELDDANGLERAAAALALSDVALEEGDFAKSVRMSHLAVESLLTAGIPPLDERQDEFPVALKYDLATLAVAFTDAQVGVATREAAGAANHTARLAIGSLAPVTGLTNRLEGA